MILRRKEKKTQENKRSHNVQTKKIPYLFSIMTAVSPHTMNQIAVFSVGKLAGD